MTKSKILKELLSGMHIDKNSNYIPYVNTNVFVKGEMNHLNEEQSMFVKSFVYLLRLNIEIGNIFYGYDYYINGQKDCYKDSIIEDILGISSFQAECCNPDRYTAVSYIWETVTSYQNDDISISKMIETLELIFIPVAESKQYYETCHNLVILLQVYKEVQRYIYEMESDIVLTKLFNELDLKIEIEDELDEYNCPF